MPVKQSRIRHHYVGREKSLRFIRQELAAGQNVLLSGSYGIGKTTLARRLQDSSTSVIYTSWSNSPMEMIQEMSAELRRLKPREVRVKTTPLPSRGLAFEKELERCGDLSRIVFIIDDIRTSTSKKLAILRALSNAHARIVAIVETNVTSTCWQSLRGVCYPTAEHKLSPLDRRERADLIRDLFTLQNLPVPSEDDLRALAQSASGFPLLIIDSFASRLTTV